ncbi:MAG: HDOD domain-containing protein [Deltaproteobacteria bacterium]|nr:HDOD domain-containing protein [Deltaproteobacteria bacterium]
MEDQKPNATNPDGTAAEAQAEGGKVSGRPFSLLLPPDMAIWQEARRLVTDKSIRVEDLAICASQDPVIVIELLRISNAMFFSGGRSPITTAKTAIVRLGSDVVLDSLEKMKDRPRLENEDVRHWFESHRSRCKRVSIVSTILAEALARTMTDDCQAAALLMYVGEMLAVAHLGEAYVKIAEELSRSGIIYRLAQDHKFDVEKMGVTYLRRQGIPEALLFVLDRDARTRAPDRAIMKPICMCASEMLEAFDANRWEKLAPGKTLPPKSAIRMLQMSDAQYLRVYERVSEFLFSLRMLEEKKKQEALLGTQAQQAAPVSIPSDEEQVLDSEIRNLLNDSNSEEDEEEEIEEAPKPAKAAPKPAAKAAPPKAAKETVIASVKQPLSSAEDQFSLSNAKTTSRTVPRVEPVRRNIEPPKLRTAGGNKVLTSITSMFDNAKSSEELLSQLLQMLVDGGPFKKSALIVVSKDRKHAIVVAARGLNIGNGQKLLLEDPLSPLAQCFSKVQSFGNKGHSSSPFGSKAFALSPIDADHDTPVALYADCGNDGSLTFEARRVFRTVVDILNQKLPQIPGGIPVELNS